MKVFYVFFFVLYIVNIHGQSKQDYVWVYGRDASPDVSDQGFLFDFNQTPFNPSLENIGIWIRQTNSSISDDEGNLLFYSNGCAVLNNIGQIMPNGDSINYDEWVEVFGVDCSLGYHGGQDFMILEDPGNQDEFYLIHKPSKFNGLNINDSLPIHYSKVNMKLDNGKGDVTLKNIPLSTNKNTLRSYLTAIHHANRNDWWLIQPMVDDSVFWVYLIDEEGITQYPNQNTHYYFNRNRSSASGTSKFSPDGSKYALYNYYDGLHLYDFDRANGTLTNHTHINIFEDININDSRFGSVEWSSNSRFIYTASTLELHQIDTWEQDIEENGIRLIETYNGTQDPFATIFYLMAQGPDCRIYLCPTSGSNSYHVINNPNELGNDCDFIQNGIKLPQTSTSGSMPNFPRFRVDEEEKCDSSIVSILGNSVSYRRDLKVYPNPSNGIFHIEIPDSYTRGNLVILNTNGEIVFERSIFNHNELLDIDLHNLPTGIYNVELYPDKERSYFYGKKVVKVD